MNVGRERRQRRWWRRLRAAAAFATAFVMDTVDGGLKYVDLMSSLRKRDDVDLRDREH